MGMIQNYCCVKVLGVSQIIRENPEIINKTDSQRRNIMHDLRQLGKFFLKWALDIWKKVLSNGDKTSKAT